MSLASTIVGRLRLVRRVDADEVFEALADDVCFANLPGRLATAFGARSALLHWVHKDGGTEILAHSRYYSEEALARYAQNFVMLDPWMIASDGNNAVDKALNLERLVAVDDFVRTRFYQEFLAPMGDDTARGMGVRVRTNWGSGFISLHRGKSQQGFEADALAQFDALSVHLRHLLCVRGRFSSLQRRAGNLSGLIDALGDALFLVRADGRLLVANAAGETLLDGLWAINVQRGVLTLAPAGKDALLKTAIARAASDSATAGAVTLSNEGGDRLNLSIVAAPAAGERHVLIVVSSLLDADVTVEERLRSLYQLSTGEARIAVQLAAGCTPVHIAEERQATIGTVRLQIKSLAAKLGCGRQADIVRLVGDLPRFASAERKRS